MAVLSASLTGVAAGGAAGVSSQTCLLSAGNKQRNCPLVSLPDSGLLFMERSQDARREGRSC
jgi:hypothetical protein